MNKPVAAALLLIFLLTGTQALATQKWISDASKPHFVNLLERLLSACETPAADDDATIDAALEAIRQVNARDYEIARAIAEHWRDVYLDDDYPLFLYHEGEATASELEQTSLRDSDRHAFVVLGYKLRDGQMEPELMRRCDAAAAAARSYPRTIIVCSGGATGDNNPMMHTEAGMMRDYLVESCGIDASRIFIDEEAMTTLQNAINTMEMLQQQAIETMTIVTSSYHQRWGQAVYNAVATLYRQYYGYSVDILANYSYDTEPSDKAYLHGERIAIRQIAHLLDVPMEG